MKTEKKRYKKIKFEKLVEGFLWKTYCVMEKFNFLTFIMCFIKNTTQLTKLSRLY